MNVSAFKQFLLTETELGKKSKVAKEYTPERLVPIPRQLTRDAIGIKSPLVFHGVDVWHAYEISWLTQRGKPCTAMGEMVFPCTSSYLIESKSLKLFLHSLIATQFPDLKAVEATLQKDLSLYSKSDVRVRLFPLSKTPTQTFSPPAGICLDDIDTTIDDASTVNPSLLLSSEGLISEQLYSDLFMSNCPVTGQPDWATILIAYRGRPINHESLLHYLLSFRNQQEFHESCVERIFMDIVRHCKPNELSVEARYTRRGGIDINPFRSTYPNAQPSHLRLERQ